MLFRSRGSFMMRMMGRDDRRGPPSVSIDARDVAEVRAKIESQYNELKMKLEHGMEITIPGQEPKPVEGLGFAEGNTKWLLLAGLAAGAFYLTKRK